jgi:hypothetical protein
LGLVLCQQSTTVAATVVARGVLLGDGRMAPSSAEAVVGGHAARLGHGLTNSEKALEIQTQDRVQVVLGTNELCFCSTRKRRQESSGGSSKAVSVWSWRIGCLCGGFFRVGMM